MTTSLVPSAEEAAPYPPRMGLDRGIQVSPESDEVQIGLLLPKFTARILVPSAEQATAVHQFDGASVGCQVTPELVEMKILPVEPSDSSDEPEPTTKVVPSAEEARQSKVSPLLVLTWYPVQVWAQAGAETRISPITRKTADVRIDKVFFIEANGRSALRHYHSSIPCQSAFWINGDAPRPA